MDELWLESHTARLFQRLALHGTVDPGARRTCGACDGWADGWPSLIWLGLEMKEMNGSDEGSARFFVEKEMRLRGREEELEGPLRVWQLIRIMRA